uniref:Uncharacterized protein n=1 Tax=Octopus bimaculoides TaxID=37653 RepID=A0A0L8FXU6_OCTBM
MRFLHIVVQQFYLHWLGTVFVTCLRSESLYYIAHIALYFVVFLDRAFDYCILQASTRIFRQVIKYLPGSYKQSWKIRKCGSGVLLFLLLSKFIKNKKIICTGTHNTQNSFGRQLCQRKTSYK